MAAKTFAATTDNLWSTVGNWGGVVPVSGDTATIPVGETCVFDVDQTAFAAGLAGLVINGELQASTTAGAYVLKLAGNATGTGTLRAGMSGTAYPAGCTFTILLNGNYKLNLTGSGSYQLYCLEPTTRMIALSGAEAAGQTELGVDTDVTADIWAAGNLVRVDDVNGVDSEQREIAVGGIAAGAITVTAALTNAKIVGAKVILISRNVKVVGNGIGTTIIAIDAAVDGVVRCEIRSCTNGINASSGLTISGTVSGCSYGILSGSGHTIGGVVSGCTNGIGYGLGHTISGVISGGSSGVAWGAGHTISGTISGCSNAVIYGAGHTISGTISGCSTGFYHGSNHTILGVLSGSVTADVYYTSEFRAFAASFLSTTEFSGYNTASRLAYHYAESIDHNGVADAFRAWCRGGIVNSVATPLPTGHSIAYQHVCESASYPVFKRWAVQVQPNAKLTVSAWLRKDASMASYLPRVQIIGQDADPLWGAGDVALDETEMTDGVDTYEAVVAEWTNTADTPRDVWIRTLAMAATGNVYAALDWEVVDVTLLADVATILSRIGTPGDLGSGATVAANLTDIEGQTDDIGAAGAGLTALPWNAAWDAEVQSEATDALNAYDPPTKTELDSAVSPLALEATVATVDDLVDDLETRLTATRAGYLDNLSAGAVALESTLTAIKGAGWSTETLAAVKAAIDAVLADTGTDGVVLAATQGAITWGQQKIVANVAGEGALDIVNTGASSYGMQNRGPTIGQFNYATSELGHGQRNQGGGYGQSNVGTTWGGQKNEGGASAVDGFDPAIATAAALATAQADLDNPDQYKANVSGLATQTSVNDLPTNAELATALASADDAVLAAIAALNDISTVEAQAAAAAALTAYAAAKTSDLSALALQASVDDLETRLTAARAGYLDNLSGGAVATATAVAALPTAVENADALLTRDMSAPTGEPSRSVLNALRFLRNKWAISGTTLTVYEEDDTTVAFTATLSTETDPDGITGADPT